MKVFSLFKNKSLSIHRNFLFTTSSFKPEDIIDIGKKKKAKGVLTICPTPIGNLHDWSLRQDTALFSADVIACEDTRSIGFLIKMLKEKSIRNQVFKMYPDHPENQKQNDQSQQSDEADEDDLAIQNVIFSPKKELEKQLPNLTKEFIEAKDINLFKQKRIEEMKQRIQNIRIEQIQHLNKSDPLNFLANEQREEHQNENKEYDENPEFDLYGITAPFLTYLKNKIKIAKERKGRGVLISCHKFNEEQRLIRLIGLLKLGFNITLVSDAGTPTISDPGYLLVSRCMENDIDVNSLPGASSITLALSLSGFPADRFQFLGFPSKSQNEKEEFLIEAKRRKETTVIFESPVRLTQLLLTIEKIYGESQLVWIGFELTKLYEKKLRKTCRQLYEDLTNPKVVKSSHLKGEVTVIIAPYSSEYNIELNTNNSKTTEQSDDEKNTVKVKESLETMIRKVEALPVASILSEKLDCSDADLSEILSKILRISRTKSYQLVQKVRHQETIHQNRKKLLKEVGINPDEKDVLFD